MNGYIIYLLILSGILLLIDLYAFQAIRSLYRKSRKLSFKTIRALFWSISIITILFICSRFLIGPDFLSNPPLIYLGGFLFAVYAGKIMIVLFLLLDDLLRLGRHVLNMFKTTELKKWSPSGSGISRLRFLSQLGVIVGSIPFLTLSYGVLRNAYNFQKRRIKVRLAGLPNAFDGFKIIQISDIHSGSFTQTDPLYEVVEMINKEEPDLIFFTGDLVNYKTSEALPYIDIFKRLQAKHGVYSILGNHDYGDYVTWVSEHAKKANLEQMKQVHEELGWKLLLNEHDVIGKGSEAMAIIGVENWGASPRFKNYGNLAQAYRGSESAPIKLLLSHDPSHWDAEITQQFKDIALTFSGHTHGMQFGVEFKNIKWSPVKYFYKQWAGLYQKGSQYLYVNRGLGFIGYPGRVGILPEVSVIQLSKA